MNQSVGRPAPAMDRDSRPWWEALARHELVVQRCTSCAAWRFPPRAICNRCASFDWSWEPAAGRGEIVSWIVNHHSFGPAFESPYVVVTVRLAEQHDLLMIGSFRGDPDSLAVGMAVSAVFDDAVDDDGAPFTVLAWTAAD